jgi:hypothetical protein
MKRIILLTSVSLSVLFSQAQITKGSFFLGGNIGAGSQRSTYTSPNYQPYDTRTTTINLNPSFGIAIKDNTVAGISLGFGHTFYNFKDSLNSQDQKNNTYGGGFYLRKYLPLGKGFYLFGEGDALYSYSNSVNSPDGNSRTITKNSSAGIYFYPGVSYTVSKHFQLEIGLNNLVSINYSNYLYEYSYQSQVTSTKSNGLSFSTNFNTSAPFNVGFRIVLGK